MGMRLETGLEIGRSSSFEDPVSSDHYGIPKNIILNTAKTINLIIWIKLHISYHAYILLDSKFDGILVLFF